MITYEIGNNEVPLFHLRYIQKALGLTRAGVNKRIDSGSIPPASFKDSNGYRLYSIEDIAMVEYVYKEVWATSSREEIPLWVKKLLYEAFAINKKCVLTEGQSSSIDAYLSLDNKYPSFSRYRFQLYLDSWRRMLLNNQSIPADLVNEDTEEYW
jgi:hypothetical protein